MINRDHRTVLALVCARELRLIALHQSGARTKERARDCLRGVERHRYLRDFPRDHLPDPLSENTRLETIN